MGHLVALAMASTAWLGGTKVLWAAPMAILTDVSGSVQLLRGGKGKPIAAKNGTQLQAGDVVRVAKGNATVYYVSRAPQALKTSQQVRVAAANAPAQKPSVWRNVYAGIASGFNSRPQHTPGTIRNVTIRRMWPINSAILQNRPTFVWSKAPNLATNPAVFTLCDAEENIIWQTTTAASSVTYPNDAPTLQPGQKYFWNVELIDENVASKLVFKWWPYFEVAPTEKADAASSEMDALRNGLRRATDGQRRFALAAALNQRGFYAEAIAQLAPEMILDKNVSENQSYEVLRTVAPNLSPSSQLLLRGLWYKTGQNQLVDNFLPKLKLTRAAPPSANTAPH